jgi:UDP-N-acetylglucosamine acyltransferase
LSEIHPHAVVSPAAKIGQDVSIGPFAIVESGASIGDGCKLESRVVVKTGTILGERNHVFEGAVLGGLPQHTQVPDRLGGLIIGDGNTIRENCTLHRSLSVEESTTVGDNNLLMVNVHVAHDCKLGDRVILTNNVMLAGHVTVDDGAYFGGGAAAHQFCRIGRLTMIGGYAPLKKDVPPFVMVDNDTGLIVGLNKVGLRRNGFTADDVAQLKAAYRLIYRSGLAWRDVVPALAEQFPTGPASEFHTFLSGGTRGFTAERRTPRNATIPLRAYDGGQEEVRAKAG